MTTADAYPWRKQVQRLLEEYGLPARIRMYESSLSSKQTTAIRKAIEALPWEYREVVTVLDCSSPSFPQLYPDIFPHWPRGRRKRLLDYFQYVHHSPVSLRTIDGWHAAALDHIATSLQLKDGDDAGMSHVTPRSREEKYREGRWPRPGWWDSVEWRLEFIGRYAFYIKEKTYHDEVQNAYRQCERNRHWNRLAAGTPFAILLDERLRLPLSPLEARTRAQDLVQNVLMDPTIKQLILERYWDPQVNYHEHPKFPVPFYAKRLGVGRTRYYQLWTEGMQKIATYWKIPIGNEKEFE